MQESITAETYSSLQPALGSIMREAHGQWTSATADWTVDFHCSREWHMRRRIGSAVATWGFFDRRVTALRSGGMSSRKAFLTRMNVRQVSFSCPAALASTGRSLPISLTNGLN
jgi:hypothetical protein